MRILIVSDAWYPQLNGVVRALSTTREQLVGWGHEVEVIGPAAFRNLPCPTYPEIRLALTTPGRVGRMIDQFAPDAVHLATEGPLGWCARHWLRRQGIPFTTSFHTMFPLYLKLRGGIPENWSFALLRLFHNAAARTMCSTQTLRATLAERGFRNLEKWVRGVDTALFRPVTPVHLAASVAQAQRGEVAPKDTPGAKADDDVVLAPDPKSTDETDVAEPELRRPILMYVGRLAIEKNLDAFLALDVPGTKVLVGDGPQRAALEARYPNAVFLGARFGDDLVAHYCAADVFVFPSKTDTLGLVMLEATACGIPVAAFPVPGPNDVIGTSGAGVLSNDLAWAIAQAEQIDADTCRTHALRHTWEASAQQFLGNLVPATAKSPAQPGPLLKQADYRIIPREERKGDSA